MLIRSLSDQREIQRELEEIGAEKGSLPFFRDKAKVMYFKVYDLKAGAANILKQELLSRGGDLVIHRHSAVCRVDTTDALMMGTAKTFKQLVEKLSFLPYWNFPQLKKDLQHLLKNMGSIKENLFLSRTKSELKTWEKPLIMGIINITPDSFFSSSRVHGENLLLKRVEEMINEGVDIIDIGGESTRPGALVVSLEEELTRIIPAVKIIRKEYSIPISIDTYKSEVARQALWAGADIINDISGLQFDEAMVQVVAEFNAPLVLMHIKGNPENMQQDPFYKDVMKEICDYFADRISYAEAKGVKPSQIIIDPGIGFGKRLQDNLTILKYLDELQVFNLPVLVGASRKSLIRDVLQLSVDERLEGTLATTAVALERGANIIRVHDIKENRRMVDMLCAIKEV